MDKKNYFTKQDSPRCIDHPNAPPREMDGEIYCSDPRCGILLDNFDLSENNNSQYAKGEELGSKIPQSTDKDSIGNSIKNKEIHRWTKNISKSTNLHKFHQQHADYDHVKSGRVEEIITNICNKIHFSKHIEDNARAFSFEIKNHHLGYKIKDNVLAAECTFLASRNLEPHKTSLEKIAEIVDEDYKTLVKVHNKIITEISKNDIKKLMSDVDGRINHISSAIFAYPDDDISQKLKKEGLNYLDDEKFESILSGTPAKSIAAGIIDIISRKNNLSVTPWKIAKFYQIHENTVRTQTKKITELLGITFLDKRKRKL
jgi:transcription initiation factor TFIIIB Brf1 subunit/transcription initiation factor TFIIB